MNFDFTTYYILTLVGWFVRVVYVAANDPQIDESDRVDYVIGSTFTAALFGWLVTPFILLGMVIRFLLKLFKFMRMTAYDGV